MHERETLEKQVAEKDIELAWEHQEVNEVHNLQKQWKNNWQRKQIKIIK